MKKWLREDIRSYLTMEEEHKKARRLVRRLKGDDFSIDFKTLEPAKRQEGDEHVD